MSQQKPQIAAIIAVAMTVVVVGALAVTLLTTNRTINNEGNVRTVGVGVYWDVDCTENVTSIDWGRLEPGDTANVTIYIDNEGHLPITLNMTRDNWDPASTSQYITLAWNRENYILNSGSTPTLLTLSVSPDITGIDNFSFDIIITGTESA